jgi:hypothetical protein
MRSAWSSLWKTHSNASRGRSAQSLLADLLDCLLRLRLSCRRLLLLGAGGDGGDNKGIDRDWCVSAGDGRLAARARRYRFCSYKQSCIRAITKLWSIMQAYARGFRLG